MLKNPAGIFRAIGIGMFLFAGAWMTSHAQYAGYEPVSDISGFKKTFALRSSRIMTIHSGFRQEKTISALTEKIVSTGTFWFKRSDKVRIEYLEPYEYLMILNGDRIFMRDAGKESHVSVRSSRLLRQINGIIVSCLQGTILDSGDFTTRVWESNDGYLMEMKPVARSLREFFDTIVLIVDKEDYSVRSIEMNEPGGDETIIIFTDKKLNGPVPDDVFVL